MEASPVDDQRPILDEDDIKRRIDEVHEALKCGREANRPVAVSAYATHYITHMHHSHLVARQLFRG